MDVADNNDQKQMMHVVKEKLIDDITSDLQAYGFFYQ